MNELKYFTLGFVFFYILQVFDVIMNLINSYSAILVTKCQVKINELGGGEPIEDPYCIGFQAPSQYEDNDGYEIEGDYIDKARK